MGKGEQGQESVEVPNIYMFHGEARGRQTIEHINAQIQQHRTADRETERERERNRQGVEREQMTVICM